MEHSVYPRACRSEEWHEETMNCLQCGRERSVVDIYDRPTISTTKIPKNLDHCTASDLDANRMIGIVCTASYTRHTPPSPPRKTLVGAQRLVCTPTASSPTSDPLSCKPKTPLSSSAQIPTTSSFKTRQAALLRWPDILLHALPQPTATRAPLPPNPPVAGPLRTGHRSTRSCTPIAIPH
jgi:hypothetical protein